MRAKRFTEEQIIGILKEAEAGGSATDMCRRLKDLERENKRLKQLLAEQVLDNQALKEMLRVSKTSKARG